MLESYPKRRANRLAGYDYGQLGCYFVTICAKNRAIYFGTNLIGV